MNKTNPSLHSYYLKLIFFILITFANFWWILILKENFLYGLRRRNIRCWYYIKDSFCYVFSFPRNLPYLVFIKESPFSIAFAFQNSLRVKICVIWDINTWEPRIDISRAEPWVNYYLLKFFIFCFDKNRHLFVSILKSFCMIFRKMIIKNSQKKYK